MRIGFLITARLKSTRLKLKVLLPLNGYSVMERLIQRTRLTSGIDDIIICTSKEKQDLPLVRTALKHGVYYFNGHADDVLQRLSDAAEFFNLDYFLSITADNPLFSIHHANILADYIRNNPEVDFMYISGLPVGANLYALRTKALKVVCRVKEVIDTEIWGYLINRPEIFNIVEIEAEETYHKQCRLTLDEIDDYRVLQEIYNSFEADHAPSLLEVYGVLDRNPHLVEINSGVVQRDLDEDIKRRIDEYYLQNREEILKIKEEIYENPA